MDALDGNAIGGQLLDLFGCEMTTAMCVCGMCGDCARLAELRVYLRGPGTVVRCPTCDGLLMVLVDVRGMVCVGMDGLNRMEGPGE